MQDQVVSIEINVPRQRVWDEITKLGRVQRAVMNTLLESALVPGAKMRYYSPDKKRVFVVGKVVASSRRGASRTPTCSLFVPKRRAW